MKSRVVFWEGPATTQSLRRLRNEVIDIVYHENGRIESLTYSGEDLRWAVIRTLEVLLEPLRQLVSPDGSEKSLIVPPATVQLLNSFFDNLFALAGGEHLACVRAYAASRFFEGAASFWALLIANRHYWLARTFWDQLLAATWKWETNRKQHIHKGTPYYFQGSTYLALGDTDSAFTCFYAALKDDEELEKICPLFKWRDTPAHRTVSLVPERDNFLFEKVLWIRGRVADYLVTYNRRGGALEFEEFDKRFLLNQDPEIENIKRVFVHTFWTFRNLEDNVGSFPSDNEFRKLRNLYLVLILCLVIDNCLTEVNKHRLPEGWAKLRELEKKSFAGNIGFNLVQVNKWLSSAQWESLRQALNPSGKPPDVFVPGMLAAEGQLPNGTPLSWQIRLILIALNLRNCASHEIQAYNVLVDRFETIFEALMHCLFMVIEQLA